MNEIEKSYNSLVRIFGNPLSNPAKIEKAIEKYELIIVMLKMTNVYLKELDYLQRHDLDEVVVRIPYFQKGTDADYRQAREFVLFLQARNLLQHKDKDEYFLRRLSNGMLQNLEMCTHNDFIEANIYGHEIKVCRHCNRVQEHDFYVGWQDMGPFEQYLIKIRTEKLLKKVNDGLDAQNSNVPARKIELG